MTRIYVALCVCALVLSGCMPSTKTTTHHYALGEPAAALPGSHHAVRTGHDTLKIARIAVPPWLAGTAMYYRLDYRNNGRLSAYGLSDWVAPPATLLEPLVQNTIAAAGGWRAVIGPHNSAMAGMSLHIQLGDFSQTFAQPKQSTGVIDATASLINEHSDSVVAQKQFHVAVAASSANAQGGAQALGIASHQFATQLERWLQSAVAGKKSEAGSSSSQAVR